MWSYARSSTGRSLRPEVSLELLEEVGDLLARDDVDFSPLGEPIAAACLEALTRRTRVLSSMPAARRDPHEVSDFVRLAVLGQLSHLLARHDLKHFAFDHLREYSANLEDGPPEAKGERSQQSSSAVSLFGRSVRNRIGVASSVLTATDAYVGYLFHLGYGSVTFKTVRTHEHAGFPAPTWSFVDEAQLPSNRDLLPRTVYSSLDILPKDLDRTTTVNSFGVPSPGPDVWQEQMRRSLQVAGEDQLFIASVMGSYDRYRGKKFLADFALSAVLAEETGVDVIELNLSCPNVVGIDDSEALCDRPDEIRSVVEAVRADLKAETQLVIKLGLLPLWKLEQLLAGVGQMISGVSGINTVPVKVDDFNGGQFFPRPEDRESGRSVAGLSGAAIKHAGLRFVSDLRRAEQVTGTEIAVMGMGGVLNSADFQDYLDRGADLVHSVTGVFVNPFLVDDCV
jgi:dihydroorotate dehydrogenase